jgi:hypothetical protein
MAPRIPKLELPVSYIELAERFDFLRFAIFRSLGDEYVPFRGPTELGIFDQVVKFEADMELRESCSEVLFACVLWLEARRPLLEILECCAPEIKRLLVYTANIFLDYIRLRATVQNEAIVSLGSSATAWLHLFAEFHHELTNQNGPRWWKPTSRRYPG